MTPVPAIKRLPMRRARQAVQVDDLHNLVLELYGQLANEGATDVANYLRAASDALGEAERLLRVVK